MKKLSIFFNFMMFGFFLIFILPRQSLATGPIDIIFDLDGTLIYNLEDFELKRTLYSKTIMASEHHYRVVDGVSEILEVLHRIPNVRISFFSAGSEDRNTEALQEIRLPSGVYAFEIAYRILSRPDLAVVYLDGKGSYKKKLGNIRDFNLSRTILVDDNVHFLAEGEELNFLKLFKNGQNHLFGERDMIKARGNLVRALGLILSSIQMSNSKNIPITHALYALQTGKCEEAYYSAGDSRNIYQLALAALYQVNPKFKMLPIRSN